MIKYKFFKDKSSVLKKYTRYLQGGTTDIFPKMLGFWDKRTDIENNKMSDIKFIINKEFESRPDKIAGFVYGREELAWLVLQYNNIVDIYEELSAGTTIFLPSELRVNTEIVTNPVRFQPQ